MSRWNGAFYFDIIGDWCKLGCLRLASGLPSCLALGSLGISTMIWRVYKGPSSLSGNDLHCFFHLATVRMLKIVILASYPLQPENLAISEYENYRRQVSFFHTSLSPGFWPHKSWLPGSSLMPSSGLSVGVLSIQPRDKSKPRNWKLWKDW